MWVFDSSNKRLDALITTQKKPQLFKLYRCWENREKPAKTVIFVKMVFLGFFSWFVQQQLFLFFGL